ncbi:MAG TPA: PIN domain-containing protein [Methanoregulaceae archaeon]|nr:PIN domain-containing protein [Methanoregulaceae archaeon]
MNHILDTSVFFSAFPVGPGSFTTPSVAEELADLASKCRFDLLADQTMQVRDPDPQAVLKIREVSRQSGDLPVLSETDIDILALASELGGAIVTDDYAIQNVAKHLKIPVIPIHQRPAAKRTWKYRCPGCGRYFKNTGECPVCGAIIRRKIK